MPSCQHADGLATASLPTQGVLYTLTRNVCYPTRRVERRAKSMPDIDLKDTLATPKCSFVFQSRPRTRLDLDQCPRCCRRTWIGRQVTDCHPRTAQETLFLELKLMRGKKELTPKATQKHRNRLEQIHDQCSRIQAIVARNRIQLLTGIQTCVTEPSSSCRHRTAPQPL